MNVKCLQYISQATSKGSSKWSRKRRLVLQVTVLSLHLGDTRLSFTRLYDLFQEVMFRQRFDNLASGGYFCNDTFEGLKTNNSSGSGGRTLIALLTTIVISSYPSG